MSPKRGWLRTIRLDWPLSRPLNRQLGDDLIRGYAHAVSQLRVGPRTGRARGFVNPITLDTAWYRQFSGQVNLPGAGENLLFWDHSLALNLMGDWCGVRREVASVIVRYGDRKEASVSRTCDSVRSSLSAQA